MAGPDIIVYTSPAQAVDLTIVAPCIEKRGEMHRVTCCMKRAHERKKRTYEEWQEQYNMECAAFVVSTNGLFSQQTIDLLEKYAEGRGSWFVSWIVLRTQKALYSAMANVFKFMRNRKRGAAFVRPDA